MASLEYAAAVLGTHTILVMGHSRCGAVTAAIQASHSGPAVPGQISALFPYIEPAVKQAGPDLEATVRANVLIQAARLRESPLLAAMIEEGKLKIAAGYFDIRSGAVTLLDQPELIDRLVAVQKGCVLGVDDAQVARQPQFGLIMLAGRIDQVGLGVGQGSLRLHHRQVIVHPRLKTIRGLFQFLARQLDVALRHPHQLGG